LSRYLFLLAPGQRLDLLRDLLDELLQGFEPRLLAERGTCGSLNPGVFPVKA
jgi:hypothetical protein